MKATIKKEQLDQYRSKKAEVKELEQLVLKQGADCLLYEARLEELKQECKEIEEFIESIEDSQMRRMFRMRFVDGMNLFLIGNKLYLDKSTVSRRIKGFFR